MGMHATGSTSTVVYKHSLASVKLKLDVKLIRTATPQLIKSPHDFATSDACPKQHTSTPGRAFRGPPGVASSVTARAEGGGEGGEPPSPCLS